MPRFDDYDYDDYDYDEYDYDDEGNYDEHDDVPRSKQVKAASVSKRKTAPPAGETSVKGVSKAQPGKPIVKPAPPTQPTTAASTSASGTLASSTPVTSALSQAEASKVRVDAAAHDEAGSASSHGGAVSPPQSKLPAYQDPATYKHPTAVQQLLQQNAPSKPPLHVVVCGHVDSGKSTLTGRLLHDLGYLDQRQVRKNQQGAQAAGKASFGWAWAMDEREDERLRGLTVDISTRSVETPRFAVTMLDAPGHQDFVPNMITGAAQADAALLVIDGSPGGFEAGFRSKPAAASAAPAHAGQTREHVHIARSCGVKQLAVVVTKLDTCGYSEERFDEIKAQLGPFLKTSGFPKPLWLPVSAPQGENVAAPPQDPRLASWWNASACLVDVIDKFEPVAGLTELPLRMVVSDVVSRQSLVGKAGVSGKVETGAVAVGARVLLMPHGVSALVKGVQVQAVSRPVAVAGECVDVGLDSVPPDLQPGCVLCHPEYPLHLATRFLGRLLVVDCPRPIIPGQRMVLHMHCTSSPCRISKLVELIDSKTGKGLKRGPAFRFLLKDQVAQVELELESALCMEVLAVFRSVERGYMANIATPPLPCQHIYSLLTS